MAIGKNIFDFEKEDVVQLNKIIIDCHQDVNFGKFIQS